MYVCMCARYRPVGVRLADVAHIVNNWVRLPHEYKSHAHDRSRCSFVVCLFQQQFWSTAVTRRGFTLPPHVQASTFTPPCRLPTLAIHLRYYFSFLPYIFFFFYLFSFIFPLLVYLPNDLCQSIFFLLV